MFDPKPYLQNLSRDSRNPRMYLPTAARVLWFRTEHPAGTIRTEIVQLDPFPVFKAVILNGDGVQLATGHGSAQPNPKAVYSGREVEKAETAAIGRALGLAGYGTQFDGDDDSDNLADSPVERKPAPVATPQPSPVNGKADISDDEWRQFAVHWKAKEGLSYSDLCTILDAHPDIRGYRGNLAAAHAAVAWWCVENPPELDPSPEPTHSETQA